MRGRYLLVLSVALSVLLAPSLAFADDGFMGGLQDLTGTRQVESTAVSPEDEFQEDYVPEVRELETVDGQADEEVSIVDTISSIWSDLRVQTANGRLKFFDPASLRYFLISQSAFSSSAFILVPAGLVFFWWGVRKALKMVMVAFRKGRASV